MKISLHKPVLLEEILSLLKLKEGSSCIDCTLGGGGYSLAISKEIGEGGKLLSLDLDAKAISRVKEFAHKEKINNIIFHAGNFKDIDTIVEKHFETGLKFSAIVADLGLSMDQLKDDSRTFSFSSPAKLNFSYDLEGNYGKSLGMINNASAYKLEEILKKYGEERFANLIAKRIVKERKIRKIRTGSRLKEVIESAVPRRYWPQHVSIATKTFQALRIVVNSELDNLEEFLPKALNLLEPRGRLAIVSFHSLEDRMVKRFFKQEASDCICPAELVKCQCFHKASIKIINKKPITASESEIKINPSSRSAKLRVIEKI